ncbi:FAD-dependent oxidoreductase [Pseudomonas syringae]|uniref:FAD-dependent oxidoreductase n=1 Tax=Pseudomonas sp. Leaf127 TaxID=1736267 RepID=UPI000702BDD3|nr:FAD-dependent oxidoreductase [Pseudomonas sp. Leaf127]KQQ53773.1 rubredoxin-NAD(+) reductase [Pseudomonas sp. Leaf127]MBD8492260.1 FAD-dependent oxidoreductase [Pseudomonas syringae]MBD8576998.1 FAD-dependent oxidoreductase [Pseudomonas syringae]
MKKWLCIICGWIYDEALGWPDDGIAPGTRWEDIPDDWVCPECKVGKTDFEMLEISGSETEPVPPPIATPAPTPVPAHVIQAVTPCFAVPTPVAEPIVIIGSGHAGYGIAQALRKSDPNVQICVLTSESGHRYYKPTLSIALAQEKGTALLIDEAPFQVESRLSIRVYPHCLVERIDAKQKRVHTNFGEISFGKLVIASGASPIRIPVDGSAEAMLSVNTLADYERFRQKLPDTKSIAILGEGLIGCEFANDLASVGYQVHVIGLGAWPMGRLLPEQAGVHLQEKLSELGVKWSLGTTISSIRKQEHGYDIQLTNGEAVVADFVLSAVGLLPNVDFVRASGIECGRGIKVDAHLQTSEKDIYAIGDCVEINGQLLPYLAPINQGLSALARTLLGEPTVVNYPLMPITVKTPSAPLSLLPPPIGSTGDWYVDSLHDGLVASHKDPSGHITGFVLLGRQAQKSRADMLEKCHSLPIVGSQ